MAAITARRFHRARFMVVYSVLAVVLVPIVLGTAWLATNGPAAPNLLPQVELAFRSRLGHAVGGGGARVTYASCVTAYDRAPQHYVCEASVSTGLTENATIFDVHSDGRSVRAMHVIG
jgi:hypothetical protein